MTCIVGEHRKETTPLHHKKSSRLLLSSRLNVTCNLASEKRHEGIGKASRALKCNTDSLRTLHQRRILGITSPSQTPISPPGTGPCTLARRGPRCPAPAARRGAQRHRPRAASRAPRGPWPPRQTGDSRSAALPASPGPMASPWLRGGLRDLGERHGAICFYMHGENARAQALMAADSRLEIPLPFSSSQHLCSS